MTPGPLRLPAPERRSDAALGERLAELARGSVPTTVPLRRRRWATPFAGAVLLLASGGVAWGTAAVAHHPAPPAPVQHGLRFTPATPVPVAPARLVTRGADEADDGADELTRTSTPADDDDRHPGAADTDDGVDPGDE